MIRHYANRNPKYRSLITSTRWRQLRGSYLSAHPLCEDCEAKGLVVPATEVHHVQPIERGGTEDMMERLAYDPANLRALCPACHHAAHEALGSQSRDRRKQRLADKVADFCRKFYGSDNSET